MATYAEQLESVQSAIAAIEGGAQSYNINSPTGGRTVAMADLKTLYDREKWLLMMIARENNGGIRVRGATPV